MEWRVYYKPSKHEIQENNALETYKILREYNVNIRLENEDKEDVMRVKAHNKEENVNFYVQRSPKRPIIKNIISCIGVSFLSQIIFSFS